MKCKYCKKLIEDDSIFCRFCGEKVVRSKKKKEQVKVPPPRQLPSGSWFGRITVDGQRIPVTEATADAYYIKARAIKTGLIQIEKKADILTLQQVLREYIDKRAPLLSPSTLRSYEANFSNRFKAYMQQDVRSIDYQEMIVNELSEGLKVKSVKNAWNVVASALKAKGIEYRTPDFPAAEERELPWLDYQQILTFIAALQNQKPDVQKAALICLHGLRCSEMLALTYDQVKDSVINVHGAVVRGESGWVTKPTNKNRSSARKVPVMIPMLQELLKGEHDPSERVVNLTATRIYEHINAVCKAAGLPEVGVHGLRRSAVSLWYHMRLSEAESMQLGGYSDWGTMRKIYTRLAAGDKTEGIKKLEEYFGNGIGNESAKALNP